MLKGCWGAKESTLEQNCREHLKTARLQYFSGRGRFLLMPWAGRPGTAYHVWQVTGLFISPSVALLTSHREV